MKSGNLNFLEPSGPLQAGNGTAFYNNRESGKAVFKLNKIRVILFPILLISVRVFIILKFSRIRPLVLLIKAA
jgi:hypothetical protein